MLNALALIFAVAAGAEEASTPSQALLGTHNAPADQFAGKSTLFGHRIEEFGSFYDTWKLVTVRYRQDTHEMRFTYANEKAWKALRAGGKSYPKGAVFAKIGFITEEDRAFTSSLVPSGAKRYQFMVRDPAKFADTDGWGYLLFNGKGKTFPGEPVQAAKACAACHRVVPERGFVFSQLVSVEPFGSGSPVAKAIASPLASGERLKFADLSAAELPADLRRQLPAEVKKIRSLEGAMRENLFEGTLNEIRPALAEETLRSGLPAALLSRDKDQFSFAHVDAGAAGCPKGQTSIAYGMTVLSPALVKTSVPSGSEKIMKLGKFCHRSPSAD